MSQKVAPKRGTKAYKAQLEDEYMHIQLFVVSHIKACSNHRVMMREVYEAYKWWRKKVGKNPTVCSEDTFGKFFPKQYPRTPMRQGPSIGKGLKDMKLANI